MAKQHLLIIIDKRYGVHKQNQVSPKKYTTLISNQLKSDFISQSKKTYEAKHNNFIYESYYFENEIPS